MPGGKGKPAASRVRRHAAEPAQPAAMPLWRREELSIAAVMAAAVLVCLRSVNAGFVYDDRIMIVQNHFLGSASFIWRSTTSGFWWFLDPAHAPNGSYYRPLQSIWLELNYDLFGLNPRGWHLAIVGLHTIVVGLVFKVTARVTADWRAALAAAMLFAVLPVRGQVIAWPEGIPYVLAAFFELAAFYLLIDRVRPTPTKLALTIVLYAAALLSHESAVAFPGLVAAATFFLDLHHDRKAGAAGPARVRHATVSALPFALEVAAYLVIRRLALGFLFSDPAQTAVQPRLAQALMTTPLALVTYLEALVIPGLAGPAHQVLYVSSPASPEFYLPVAALVAAAAIFYLAIRRHPHRSLYLFCAVWIGLELAPVLDLKVLPNWGLVADRYLYVPSFGWCLMVGDWVSGLAGHPRRSAMVWGATGALLAIYAALLWQTEDCYRNNLTFFTACVEKFPESTKWRGGLVKALEERGNLAGALAQLEQAQAIDPHDSDTLFELAFVHMQQGKLDQAAREAQAAIAADPRPLPREYILLAKVYDAENQPAPAQAALSLAASRPQGEAPAAVAGAQMAMRHGDPQSAETILRDATRRFPDDVLPWMQLGVMLAGQARYAESLSAFGRALELAPNDSSLHLLMAGALHALGRNPEALNQCRLALAAAPDDPNARALMAQIERQSVTP
jgi:protein O-mannosyl-transferase